MDEPCFALPEDAWSLRPADHRRTIIHLDVDCFYAQVEMVREPSLKDKPLGVKQKNLVVTCNYVARAMGVKKCMWVKEALQVLPDLVLVDGSDLTHYRHFSAEISAVAQSFTAAVERLGLDENFVDVTDIIGDYLGKCDTGAIKGHVYGEEEADATPLADACGCGCLERLTAGALLAQKLRQQIFEATGITCCAGIAHNKLLAKLVSGHHKPNQQTVLFPWMVRRLMTSLDSARTIPSIGSTTFRALEHLGVSTVADLQSASLALLRSAFDEETSKRLKDLSFGIDETPVRRSSRPQSLGLEDAFRKVTCVAEVHAKYSTLLDRLLKLLEEDGRIPASLRVCVRKFDLARKFGHRESRQAPIPTSMFASGVRSVGAPVRDALLDKVMSLFHKMVDTSRDFHLTLVAVGFNKFIERAAEEKSISRFFVKRKKGEYEDEDANKSESEDSKHARLLSSETDSSGVGFNGSESSLMGQTNQCSMPDDATGGIKSPRKKLNSSSTPSKQNPFKNFTLQSIKATQHNTNTTEPETDESQHINTDKSNIDTSKETHLDESNKETHHDGTTIRKQETQESCDVRNDKSKVSIHSQDKGERSNCSHSPHSTTQAPHTTQQDTHSPHKDTSLTPPPGVDIEVFKALPPEIQHELSQAHKVRPPEPHPRPRSTPVSPKVTRKRKSVTPTLERYFKRTFPTTSKDNVREERRLKEGPRNTVTSTEQSSQYEGTINTTNDSKEGEGGSKNTAVGESQNAVKSDNGNNEKEDNRNSMANACFSKSSNNSDSITPLPEDKDCCENRISESVGPSISIRPPEGVDSEVFESLPEEIQREVVENWKRKEAMKDSVQLEAASSTPSNKGRGASSLPSSSSSSLSSIMKYVKKM